MKMLFLIVIFFDFFAKADTVSREKLSELHKIRSEIKIAVFDQARYKQDILKAKLDIEIQNKEIEKNQFEAQEIKKKIIERITTLYKIRRAYPEGTLLSLAKEEDFLRKNYYLNYLNKQDRKLVSDYKIKTAQTEKLRKKVQSYMKRLIELQKKSESRFADLSQKELLQRQLIRKIRDSVKGSLARDENKKFFSELRGQLQLPVTGLISGQFGIQSDSSTNLTVLNTGIKVNARSGSEVKSIFDGKVLHVDNVQGWGPTIIVDHGESYYSVYSHIKNLSVRPGEQVLTQQKLAEVGEVPYHKGSTPGLYFEIRHYSEPEDPKSWFTRGD